MLTIFVREIIEKALSLVQESAIIYNTWKLIFLLPFIYSETLITILPKAPRPRCS